MAVSVRALLFITLAVIAGAGGWAGRRAEAQGSSPPDTLATLLTEVHGLRLAMEQMATAGPRIQLALGRLQLQEQRVNNMLRRLETLRGEIDPIQAEHDQLQLQIQRFEREIAEQPNTPERRDVEAHVRGLRAQLALVAKRVQQRQSEETTLAADIGSEQARWNDFNQRLDELERALGRK